MANKLTEQERKDQQMFEAGMGALFPFVSATMLRRMMWPVVRGLPDEARNDFIEAALIAANANPKG